MLTVPKSKCKQCLKPIHSTRNKIGLCQDCRKIPTENPQAFSFEEGSEQALGTQGQTVSQRKRSHHFVHSVDCQPFSLEVFDRDKRTKLSTTFALMTNDSALSLTSLIDFQNNITSGIFDGRISFSSNDTIEPVLKDSACIAAKLEMTVRASTVPKLLQKLGPYQEIDATVLDLLNYDFQLRSELIELIPPLFCGALLHDSITLLIITCEVYSRHSSVDIHSESTEFSVPGESSRYKNRLSCTTYEKSDGGATKLKLIIGTKTVNLLITCSAEISTEPKINIGPGVEFGHGSITDSNCKIYLMKSKVEEFLKMFETFKLNPLHVNISNLRQITSSFSKCSSYLLWRSTLQEFDSSIYSPATVFTLCDLPNKDGYGVGATSGAKLGSQILQILAKAILVNKGVIQPSDFYNVLLEYESIMKQKCDVKEWFSIIKVMDGITASLNSSELSVPSFCNNNSGSVSEVANKLSSSISTANNMIAKNVKKKLLQLYQ